MELKRVILLMFGLISVAHSRHKHQENEPDILKWAKFDSDNDEIKFSFMVSGRNFQLGSIADANAQLNVFYKTYQSDLNNQSSEVVTHSSNPSWMTVFKSKFDSTEGDDQEYIFKVKSFTEAGHAVSIGEAKMGIQKIWRTVKQDGEMTLPLTPGGGHLIITKTDPIAFRLSASNLAKRDTFGGKSDPYVKCLWSRGPDGPEVEFFRTSWIGNVVDAEWMEIVAFEAYQKGTDQYLHFKLYDDDGITSDDFLGEAFLKIDDHLKTAETRTSIVALQNEPSKKNGKGTLTVTFLRDSPNGGEMENRGKEFSREWFYN